MFILMPEPSSKVNRHRHWRLHCQKTIDGRLHGACMALTPAMPLHGV
jgi:hypothetical protein